MGDLVTRDVSRLSFSSDPTVLTEPGYLYPPYAEKEAEKIRPDSRPLSKEDVILQEYLSFIEKLAKPNNLEKVPSSF